MIGRCGERGSGIFVLAARHDDDDDIYIYIYIYIWKRIMDSNLTVCEEKLTSNPNRKVRFIKKQSRHYSVSVQLNHHQGYEGLLVNFSSQTVRLLSIIFFHLTYMYKEDLTLNNLQGLICHKILTNQI